ncbi:aldo/keto reductase [Microbacterium sp. A196]|uniref:aldo/keto reductase n=1 Tax=unclassified Microbacterium TaxID=2609290 RepID=UPI003FD455AC
MQRRALGEGDLAVGAIGFGCMSLSGIYSGQPLSADEARTVIHGAVDAGTTLIDTAHAYGGGHNERLLGSALDGIRSRVAVATKAGLVPSPGGGAHVLDLDGRPELLRAQVDESLSRLDVDRIDIQYLHRIDPKVPLEDSWGALAELVTAGKVARLGLSEVTVEQAERAHRIHPVAAIQSEFSLWAREALTSSVVAWCAAQGAAFVPFSPLGQGFLTGSATRAEDLDEGDARTSSPRFTAAAARDAEPLTDAVREVAAEHGATAPQVALAWLLAQGAHVIPIPGTRRVRHAQSNAAAADLHLSAQAIERLDRAVVPTPARH